MIINYLPKLKVFRLKMEFYFRDRIKTRRYANQLLNSFQTQFWLAEREWFIRLHYHPGSGSNYVCLYTRIEVSGCRSTCSNDDNQSWSYDHVHTVHYRVSLSEALILNQSCFVNIQHLSL